MYVDKKYFPDFNKIERLLTQLVSEINSRIEQATGDEILKLAADIHYNLVNIHPFGDGNGRTARLLMNYVQLFHNEPLIKVFTEDRVDYFDALNRTEEAGDGSIFRDFICSQQMKFYESEIEKFSKRGDGFRLMF